jgi:hypothetical protein
MRVWISILALAATRHDANGSKRVDRIAMLVESCPFDPSDALGLCLRRRECDHLPFEVKPIARTDGGEPPQFVDAKPKQWIGDGRDIYRDVVLCDDFLRGDLHRDDVQQETQRVDQDVPLATFDLLARVVARRIKPRPPF